MQTYTREELSTLYKMLFEDVGADYEYQITDLFNVFRVSRLGIRFGTTVTCNSRRVYRRFSESTVNLLFHQSEDAFVPMLEVRDAIFERPLTDMPLLLDRPILSTVARWRFQIGR